MRSTLSRIWIACLLAPGVVSTAGARQDREGLDPETGALKAPLTPDHARIGVSHESPRYRPRGKLGPTILPDGAADAYSLGFRTIKIGMDCEVTSPAWRYYSLETETLSRVKTLVDLARLDAYRRVFETPFHTIVITADAIGEVGTWHSLARTCERGAPRPVDVPLSDEAKRQIYGQIHDLAVHLLRTYGGSRKVFILQNHETDWHVVPYPDEALDPSDVALANAVEYFRLRQQAVDDARREVGETTVYVYHMAEVVSVFKSMRGGKTVTNLVLPRVRLDLVGYSCWESAATNDGRFLAALDYLRSRTNPSYAFGRNNVVVSELGVGERSQPDVSPQLRAMLEAAVTRVPYVLIWNLYDNDAHAIVNGRPENVWDAAEAECAGLWVRKPDGGLGRLFRAIQPYLADASVAVEPTDSRAYVDHVYRLLLGRAPDPQGLRDAVRLVDEAPWDKEQLVRILVTSPEYRERTAGSSAAFAFDVYRVVLGRNPEPAALAALWGDYRTDAARLAYVANRVATPEAGRRFVDWSYRRANGREPDGRALAEGVARLARGVARRDLLAVSAPGRLGN